MWTLGTSGRRRGAPVAYGSFILLAFVFVIAVAVIPSLGAAPWVSTQLAIPSAAIPTLTATWTGGERRLPLVNPGGKLDRAFPQGIPQQSSFGDEDPAIQQLLRELIFEAGLDSHSLLLLERDPRPFVRNDAWTEGEASYVYTYPYRYPAFDRAMAESVDGPLRTSREAALVDLSSAFLFTDRAPAAFALLQRMKSLGNNCSVQLNLAQTVALGYAPDRAVVDAEFTEAERLCTDDPIAWVAHSRAVLAFDTRGSDVDIHFKVGALGQEDKAIALAREAQRRFPTHVGGYLAEAAIQLEVASEYALLNRHPFTTRAMLRRALDLLTAVVAIQHDDPTVDFGIARAEAGLGDPAAALRTGGRFMASFSHSHQTQKAVAQVVTGWALDAGDAKAALRGIEAERVEKPFGEAECLSLNQDAFNGARGTAALPEPGWRGNCNVQLVDATGGDFAGGADLFSYLGYIPRYRTAVPSEDVLAVLAGATPESVGGDFETGERFRSALDGEWTGTKDDVETFQDALRRVGQFDRAEALLRSAAEAGADEALTIYDRLGEVLFLQEKYREAAEAFAVAAERGAGRSPEVDEWDETDKTALSAEWSSIKQATALHRAGEDERARAILRALALPTEGYNWRPGLQEQARSTLLGIIAMKESQFAEAEGEFERALTPCEEWIDSALSPCWSGVQENNLAIALMKAGRHERSIEFAQRAIARDPKNPMFVEGLANALEANGDPEAAAGVYRQATEQDATQFTAQNNLGVILARKGDLAGAIGRFRQAVAGNPDYPAGWHNLGVAWAATGDFGDSVRSQGALGRAATLDPAFRDAAADWVTDTTVYDPGLDLSKPLPKDWAAGTNRKPLPVAFAIPLLLASALHVVRALVSENLYGRLTEWALGWTRRRPFSSLVVPRWGELVAVLVCALVLGAGMGGSLGWTPWVTAAGFLAALLTVWSYVTTRKLLSSGLTHHGSVGGTVVGVLGAPFGVSFAPVPVVEGHVRPWVRWAPLAVTTALAVLAMGLTLATGIPVVRAVAQAALLVVGSSLIPIEPFEGTKVPRALSLPLAIALAVPTVAFSALWL